jgi:ADP-heptose:LPS heptosyltransferase
VPELVVSEAERAECRTWLNTRVPGSHPVILIHPGNKKTMSWRTRSGNLKDWPAPHWCAVARAVLERIPEARVLITGTALEARMTQAISASCADARVLSIAGETPLRRLLALLGSAHSLISVDTGPAHAAAALGCPLVVLFGQTDPRTNRPVSAGSPVEVVTGPPGAPVQDGEAAWRAHHHMTGISPQAVISAWQGLGGSTAAVVSATSAQ